MKIYIKPYLRKLPIIDMLYQSIVEYARLYGAELSENEDAFSDFKYQKKTESVTKYLDYMLPTTSDMYEEIKSIVESEGSENFEWSNFIGEDGNLMPYENIKSALEEIRDGNLKYLIRMFYSVKGCWRVLEYLKNFNLLGTGNEYRSPSDPGVSIEYNVKNLSIEIRSLDSRYDSETFFTLLKEFLASLLYYNKIFIKIQTVNVEFEGKLSVDIHHGAHFFDLYNCKIN